MPLATLSIDLEAKLANLEAGMDKAARLAEKNAALTEASWKRAASTMAGLGAALAGAFAGFSLVEFVRSNADAIDKLNDVADATGASIENISALEDLAKRTGTTLEVATTALVKLNGALNEAKPDNPISRALGGIGLEADKLRGLDPAEALRQVAVALSGYADDGNKARLVQELFGKSLREVAPLLNDLAEKTTLVGTVTTEQAKQAEKFNKQLFELQTNSANVARVLTADLLPALNGIFDSVKRNGGLWGAYVEGFKIRGAMSDAANAQRDLAIATKQLEAGLTIPEAQRTGIQKQRIQELREEIAGLMRYAANAAEELKKLGNGGQPVLPKTRSEMEAEARRFDKSTYEKLSVGDGGKTKDGKARPAEQISEAQRALASYVAELQKELDKTEQLSEQQKALNLLKSLGTTGQVPEVRELVLGMERQITLARQDNAIREDNLRIIKEQEAAQRALNDELYRLSGRQDDARKIALTTALEQQLADGVQYSPAELDKLVKGIAGLPDEGKKAFDELDELAKQFGRNVQDALGDTLLDTLKGDFDSILALWGNLLLKMAAQAAAAEVGKSLFGDTFFKSSGEGAGQLGGLFGDMWKSWSSFTLASGGVVDGAGITQFAKGDIFDQATRFSYAGGRIGEMGEAGPEAVMPLRRGRDGKLGVAASGGGGNTYHFHIASGVTRPELVAMVPQLTAQIKAEVQASARRPGGGF